MVLKQKAHDGPYFWVTYVRNFKKKWEGKQGLFGELLIEKIGML